MRRSHLPFKSRFIDLKKYELAFANLSSKHAELTMLIEGDEEFEHKEAWMEESTEFCQ